MPLRTAVANVKGPFAVMIGLSAPLCRVTPVLPTASPVTVPPTVKALVVQVTVTLVTLMAPTTPLPFATVQDWLGFSGWVVTVTT